MFALEVKWFLAGAIWAKVKNKASVLYDHLLLFLENCRERYINISKK